MKAFGGQTGKVRSKAGLERAGGAVGTVALAAGRQMATCEACRADPPILAEKPGHLGYGAKSPGP